MANLPGSRIRNNGVFGNITDNPLAIGATSFNSPGLANLGVVSGDHAIVTLDPLRQYGAPEIVMITSHTGSATVATITRGMYGTIARAHTVGTLWANAPVTEDFIVEVLSGSRPADPYRGQVIFETNNNTFTARDTSDAWQTMVALGVWNTYTPALVQGVGVTSAATYAKYQRVGRIITVEAVVGVSSLGTAANGVTISLPVTAASANDMPCGIGQLFDQSAGLVYRGIARLNTTTTVVLFATNSTANVPLGIDAFTASLAAGDRVDIAITYEAAS